MGWVNDKLTILDLRRRLFKAETEVTSLTDTCNMLMTEPEEEYEVDIEEIFFKRYAQGVREGYLNGCADGSVQVASEVTQELARHGIHIEVNINGL